MLVAAWWQCPGLLVWRGWEQVATPGSIVLVFPAPAQPRRSGDRWSACPMLTGAPSVWGGVSGPGAGRGGGGLRTPTLAGRWSRVPGCGCLISAWVWEVSGVRTAGHGDSISSTIKWSVLLGVATLLYWLPPTASLATIGSSHHICIVPGPQHYTTLHNITQQQLQGAVIKTIPTRHISPIKPQVTARSSQPTSNYQMSKYKKEKSIKQTRIGHFLSWLAH